MNNSTVHCFARGNLKTHYTTYKTTSSGVLREYTVIDNAHWIMILEVH